MAAAMATEPGPSKHALRAVLTKRRAAARGARGARLSRAIARRVTALSAWKRSRVILAYVAVRGEADPRPLVRRALAEGRVVALPRVTGPSRGRGAGLSFHRIAPDTVLVPGRFGIPEPPEDPATSVDPREADLVLVPGVAFSPAGDRLGYGGGYYDALLPGTAAAAVGLAYEFQVLPGLPRDRRDIRLDAVVTERRVLFGRGRRHSLRSSMRVPPTKN
jgi:5-formyltetrahydrofolate cyclo-ligase